MRRDLDQPRKSGPGDRLDPTRARPEPWFVGNGRGLMVAVLLVCAVLLVLRVASLVMLAEETWGWWTAPRPVMSAAAPPAAAPLPPRKVSPVDPSRANATLAGNPAAAFTSDDYPPAAIRAEEQGRSVAKLSVDASGTPTACTITKSSGSRSLDEATCRVALQRVRYDPARDRRGAAIQAEATLPVRWALPRG